MGFDVNAKNVKLWKNEHEGRKGKFYTFSVSASKKMQDGTTKYKSMRVFSKDIPQDIPNGTLVDIEGFITLDVYSGRDGEVSNIAIYAQKITAHDWEDQDLGDNFDKLEEDIPF